MCSLGIELTTFALPTQCSTTEPQEHLCNFILFVLVNKTHVAQALQSTMIYNEYSTVLSYSRTNEAIICELNTYVQLNKYSPIPKQITLMRLNIRISTAVTY